MAGKRIVVVGGGVCGVVFSRRLRERLGSKSDAELVMVSRDEYHYMPAFFPDVAFGEARPEDVRAPLAPVAERLGVRLLLDTVLRADLANRALVLEKAGSLEYDYLVVCAGSRYGWDAYPGLSSAHHNYTLDGALKLREALAGLQGGRVVFLVPEFPYRCPGYVFEAAAKILVLARRRGVEDRTSVVVLHSLPLERAMQRFFDVARSVMEIHEMLGGVEYYFGARLERVEPGERRVYLETGESFDYDLLVAVPPPRPPKPFDETELVWGEDKRFLETRFPSFRSPRYDDVYVPTDGAMTSVHLPFAGVPVHYAAIAAADNIAAEIEGGVAGENPFPDNLTFLLDFGVTGGLVAFDVRYAGGGKASIKPYMALTHPVLRQMKYAFYKSWIRALKA